MQYLIIGTVPIIIAFLISVKLYKKLEPEWFRLFTWFLLFSFLIQYAGFAYSAIFKDGDKPTSNHFIFNFETLVEYGFYLLIYYLAVQKTAFKRLVMFAGCLFIVSYIYNIGFAGSFFIYNTQVIIIGCVLTLMACMLYLAELLMSDQVVNFFKMPLFWITTGIMISAVGVFLYLAFFSYILKYHLDPHGLVYLIMFTSLSVLEYCFFSIGLLAEFIWKGTN